MKVTLINFNYELLSAGRWIIKRNFYVAFYGLFTEITTENFWKAIFCLFWNSFHPPQNIAKITPIWETLHKKLSPSPHSLLRQMRWAFVCPIVGFTVGCIQACNACSKVFFGTKSFSEFLFLRWASRSFFVN